MEYCKNYIFADADCEEGEKEIILSILDWKGSRRYIKILHKEGGKVNTPTPPLLIVTFT